MSCAELRTVVWGIFAGQTLRKIVDSHAGESDTRQASRHFARGAVMSDEREVEARASSRLDASIP